MSVEENKLKSQLVNLLGDEKQNSSEFDVVMDWAKTVRRTADEYLLTKFQPAFSREFETRLGEKPATMREAASWANAVLNEFPGICAKSPSESRDCIFVFSKGRTSDGGRVYLQTLESKEFPRRTHSKIEPPLNVHLGTTSKTATNQLSRNR